MINGFKQLWDVSKDGGDSTIISIDNKIYKIYFEIDFFKKELLKYIKIQNKYSDKIFTLELKNSFEYNGEKIKKINIKFLKLSKKLLKGCNLQNRLEVYINETENIEGKTLYDLHSNNQVQEDLLLEIFSYINSIITHNMNINSNQGIINQLNGINVKVSSIENGEMDLIITDIATSIKIFIRKNSNIGKILHLYKKYILTKII